MGREVVGPRCKVSVGHGAVGGLAAGSSSWVGEIIWVNCSQSTYHHGFTTCEKVAGCLSCPDSGLQEGCSGDG